jgi:hypothetical protein
MKNKAEPIGKALSWEEGGMNDINIKDWFMLFFLCACTTYEMPRVFIDTTFPAAHRIWTSVVRNKAFERDRCRNEEGRDSTAPFCRGSSEDCVEVVEKYTGLWRLSRCTHMPFNARAMVSVENTPALSSKTGRMHGRMHMRPWPECDSILNFFEEGPPTPVFFESHLK